MELALSTDYVGIYLSTNIVPRDENILTIHVNGRKWIVGIALVSESKSCFCPNIESSYLDSGSIACFAICMQSSHTSDLVYVMEFYLKNNDWIIDTVHFLNFLLCKMKRNLKSFKMACGKQLGEELVVGVVDHNANKLKSFLRIGKGGRLVRMPNRVEQIKNPPLIEGTSVGEPRADINTESIHSRIAGETEKVIIKLKLEEDIVNSEKYVSRGE